MDEGRLLSDESEGRREELKSEEAEVVDGDAGFSGSGDSTIVDAERRIVCSSPTDERVEEGALAGRVADRC